MTPVLIASYDTSRVIWSSAFLGPVVTVVATLDTCSTIYHEDLHW